MHLFWQSAIKPILDAVAPSVIVEVGAADGHNTRNLVQYAVANGCALHVVDPKPLFDADEMAGPLGQSFVLHSTRSLNALPEIADPDIVLLDGDHNWYTVYHELQLIEKGARKAQRPFPVVLLHDVDWPYGRRDLYYEPDAIPPGYRLPHRQEGLLPTSAELIKRGGLNGHLHNAIYTHNVRNGVRTAVEDFLSEGREQLLFHTLPGNHGLGILAPNPAGRKGAAALRRQFAHFTSAQFVQEQGQRIEELRIESVIAAKDEKRRRQGIEEHLTGEVSTLKAARDEAQHEREELRSALDQAADRAAAIERQHEALESAHRATASELKVSTSALEAATEQAEAAASKVASLRSALGEAEERAAAAERACAELAAAGEQRIKGLETEHDALVGQLRTSAAELEAAQKQAEAAATEAASLRSALRETEERAAAAGRDRGELSAQLEARASAAARAEDVAASSARERDQLQNMLAQGEERAAGMQRRVESLEAERHAMVRAIQASTAEARTSAVALRESKQRAAAVQQRLQVLETEHEATADALEASAAALETTARQVDAAAMEAAAARGALCEAEERAAASERDRAKLWAQLDMRAREVARAESATATVRREREQLQDMLDRLEELAAARQLRTEGLEAERDALALEIASTADALRQAERSLDAAEVVREQAQASTLRLEQEARAEAQVRAEVEQRAKELQAALRAVSGQAAAGAAAGAELARYFDKQAAERRLLLEALESHIERTAASSSFRHGHRFFRLLALLTFRRPKHRRSALDLAADATLRLKELERESAPPPAATGTANGKPPASRALAVSRTAGEDADFALEEARRTDFRDRYAALRQSNGLHGLSDGELGGPVARDGRAVLVGLRETHPAEPSADVIVCVKDALEDVRSCLWSVLHYTDRPFRLIVVDDGSKAATRSMLDELAAREPAIELLRNEGPEHGYTRAANMGLRVSTADYAVLLNSDTVVTPGWLDRLIACGESDERIGVVGPLSNAATHQSIPHVKHNGGWAVNELPPWMTPATMAFLVAGLSDRPRPRFPFVNGFCYAIKRHALERVGLLDEELFGSGYCEENDLSVRLQDAGFSLAVADDSYVFHAKSRSYAPEGRKAIAGDNYKRFLQKHGEERIESLLKRLDGENGLSEVRRTMVRATNDQQATVESFRAAYPRPLDVLFVLHGMSEGSSGGGHSIYQEVCGMQRLGIPARIALGAKGLEHARAAYPDADGVFVPFCDFEELEAMAARADVVVATHFTTVALVQRLREERCDFLAAYYVQDYEPFFLDPVSARLAEAADSYTALPDLVLFAKTHWLCNVVGSAHGVHVAKVEPSIDEGVFNTEGRSDRDDGRVRVMAMIRPRTPRRQAGATLATLDELRRQCSDRVRITTFGCSDGQMEAIGSPSPAGDHKGILNREEVADLLRDADVFLDLSTYQAFGRTALEAMACGCTAVLPGLGGVHEFARHDENAVVVDGLRPQASVTELMKLVNDPVRLSRLKDDATRTAYRYSVLKASLSEYSLFDREFHSRQIRETGALSLQAR